MLNAEENKGLSERNPAGEQRAGKARQKKAKSVQAGKPEPDQTQRELAAAPTALSETDAIMAPAPVDSAPVVETSPGNLQPVWKAYEDYNRKSVAQSLLFFEKLAGIRSLNKLVELQTEFVRQAYDSLVADSHRMWALHREMARERLALFEELTTKMIPPAFRQG